MSIVNRILVTGRMENGDTVDVSCKVTNREFNAEDAEKFRERLRKQLNHLRVDTLYYQVRTWSGNAGRERQNWSRVLTWDTLDEVISEVMCHEKAAD